MLAAVGAIDAVLPAQREGPTAAAFRDRLGLFGDSIINRTENGPVDEAAR